MGLKYRLFVRGRRLVNTDPQRRCYNGAFISSKMVWTPWEQVCDYTRLATAEESKRTFEAINATRFYKIEPVGSVT